MRKKIQINDMIYAALFATLISVFGYIAIPLPFSPVPLTGQTLMIMLVGCVLTPLQAGLSVITFIFMGIIGLPVFSGGASGIGVIVGSNGGYLMGFLIGSIVICIIKNKNNSIISMISANIIGGIVVVYILGVLWLSYITGIGVYRAFIVGALPFIIGDLIKAVIAALVAKRINTLRR
ncbi:biotin transporter BioY [Clostridium folliculivorans]|uniref:Biotin transporter n=1 Tax=Clostridium folliculivorans TaxID=2886038 RepID=A0A9W5Y1M4_9CLOT|nr:biotin transporter BioY [Clostridium folliculivorans]GKU24988.1 biotin biosynthesis protein BioY [Clostridium folliculivorans]GKU31086.1 biotin biosynthesis protein BioY [Clostridium folliculivorans]